MSYCLTNPYSPALSRLAALAREPDTTEYMNEAEFNRKPLGIADIMAETAALSFQHDA